MKPRSFAAYTAWFWATIIVGGILYKFIGAGSSYGFAAGLAMGLLAVAWANGVARQPHPAAAPVVAPEARP